MTDDSFPETPEALRESSLVNQWWYYGFELLPGVSTKGFFPSSMPLLPRLMLRECRLRGMDCLDTGSMEGLMPVLMGRAGAGSVMAVDGVDHCVEKMAAVKHYQRAEFDYRTVGPMYELSDKLDGRGFDLINCSGLLYHVLSPLLVLTGLRGALKRNGLMIVSTNVIVDREAFAEFNAEGRLQEEPNTFWYLSTGLLDYVLRYLRLAPIACLHQPHDTMTTKWRMRTGKPSAYLSVLCRATDEALPAAGDDWMRDSVARSWEYEWLPDWERAEAQPVSRIRTGRRWSRARPMLDITTTVESQTPRAAAGPDDGHSLRLSARR